MTGTFAIEGANRSHENLLRGKPWGLCIGAGINGKAAPSWDKLTSSVVNELFEKSYTLEEFSDIVKGSGWSFDAWLQLCDNYSAFNRKSDAKALIRKHIYSVILEEARASNIEKQVKLALTTPSRVPQKHFPLVVALFKKVFAGTTVLKLAEVFVERVECRPEYVINFNADTFFETLSFLLMKEKHNQTSTNWEAPPKLFARVAKSKSFTFNRDKIPIFHLHGYLVPQNIDKFDEFDDIVFSESDYLSLTHQTHTWAQSTFTYFAQYSTMLFVGLSMADPNIRRWLSWVWAEYVAETIRITKTTKLTGISGRHYWISARPKDTFQALSREYGLRHLGVQTCWIDKWGNIGEAIKNLTGKT